MRMTELPLARARKRGAMGIRFGAIGCAVLGSCMATVTATSVGLALGAVPSSEQLLSCNQQTTLRASILAQSPMMLDASEDRTDHGVVANLRTANADQQFAFGELLTTPVRILGTTGNVRSYLMGDPSSARVWTASVATMQVLSITGCSLRTTVEGLRSLQIWLQTNAPKLSPSTRVLNLLVQDEVCGGGGSTVAGRLVKSVVVHPTTVEIGVALRPLPEQTPDGRPLHYDCRGYPPTPIAVRLPARLGNRTVMNASQLPAVALTRWAPPKFPPPIVAVPKPESVVPPSTVNSTTEDLPGGLTPCREWVVSETGLGRREGALLVTTPTHVVIWGGDGGSGSDVQLSGASLNLAMKRWVPMLNPPQSSPQGAATTTSGLVMLSAHTPSLFDPARNDWRDGWHPRQLTKNPPMIVETPRHFVVIQRDALRGVNEVEIADRSGIKLGESVPSPPVVIGYEAAAVWVPDRASEDGRVIVIKASGIHLSLDVAKRTWSRLPRAPLDFVNRNLVVAADSQVTVLGVTRPATSGEAKTVAFAFFNVQSQTWTIGPATTISPTQLQPVWGGRPRPTQLLRSSDKRVKSLFVVMTNQDATSVARYGESGFRLSELPLLPALPTNEFVALPDGSIGTLLRDGSWATAC